MTFLCFEQQAPGQRSPSARPGLAESLSRLLREEGLVLSSNMDPRTLAEDDRNRFPTEPHADDVESDKRSDLTHRQARGADHDEELPGLLTENEVHMDAREGKVLGMPGPQGSKGTVECCEKALSLSACSWCG